MRRVFLLLIISLSLQGCQSEGNEEAVALQMKIYKQAMEIGDLSTAVTATHALLALDSSKNNFRDTLVMLYFQDGRYVQSARLAAQELRKNPENRKYLEIMARSLQGGGRVADATGYYEKLHEMTGDPVYEYQLAALNFNAERYPESEKYVQKLLNDPKCDTAHVRLFASDGQAQQILLKAAAFNMLGSIQARQKNKEQALINFHKALALDSTFTIARENIKLTGG